MMKLILDVNGYVKGYALSSDTENVVEYSGEIPSDFEQNMILYKVDGEELIFDTEKYNAMIQKELAMKELQEIGLWFKWYDIQVAQYERSLRVSDLSVFSQDITLLDTEANEKQHRVRELKTILEGD